MKLRRIIALAGIAAAAVLVLFGCTAGSSKTATSGKKTVLKVTGLETAYGTKPWKEVVAAFEKQFPNVTVKLTLDKQIENIIEPQMKAGDYPDVMYYGLGHQHIAENLIQSKGIEDVSDVLKMTIPGEKVTVQSKLMPGIIGSLWTAPYGDGKTYLMPIFYAPTGLFYNKTLFKQNGWTVPTTWDQMWTLAAKAKAKGISLFTYATPGYLDSYTYTLLTDIGGQKFFNQAMTYQKGAWSGDNATQYFDLTTRLLQNADPTTVANANTANYKKNQSLILNNKALFMPNGTWVPGEMKDAPRTAGFEWGMAPVPGITTGNQYVYTYFEQMWIPKASKQKALAKKFLAFLYSDKAVKIFAEAGAIQPVQGASKLVTGDNKTFYKVYDQGAKVVVGGFDSSKTAEGVDITNALFDQATAVTNKTKTAAQWQAGVIKAADTLRAAPSK